MNLIADLPAELHPAIADGRAQAGNTFYYPMPTPAELHARLPASAALLKQVSAGRQAVREVMSGEDPRWLVVIGPCSIHDPVAGLDYAWRLASLAAELDDTLLIVMRAYFEKPRTMLGWKGLINDPYLDGSHCIDEGLAMARQFLLDAASCGLPLAGEALDPISPLYLGDLFSWMAIGARTTESQIHRELASGMDCVVGFKNGTDGSLDSAVHAIVSAGSSHRFLGSDGRGRVALVHSKGNPDCHIVLRGGGGQTNYDAANIARTELALRWHELPEVIMVDCAHGNSGKLHTRQPLVLQDVLQQITTGNRSIRAVMIESFLTEGTQALLPDRNRLRYGCSVTDPCLDWATTEVMLREARLRLQPLLR